MRGRGTPAGNAVRNPGALAIAMMEAGKAILALLAAAGLAIAGPQPLRHGVHDLLARLGLDAERGATVSVLDQITPDAVDLAAALLAVYGLVRVAEAWGLWRSRAWASWLGCISAAIYLPLDVYAIVRHPGVASSALLAVNLLVVAVLAQDLRRRRSPIAA